MALKLWETIGLQDADEYIQSNSKSAAKMKKRMRDTMRKRMKVLAAHGKQNTEGYRWMEIAMRESLGPVTAYSLSRLSNLLGSKRTSLTGLKEIQKKALEKINLEFGVWKENPDTGKQELEKPFINNLTELEGFFDVLNWFKDNVIGFAYKKEQRAKVENIWSKMQNTGQTWDEVKTYLETEKEKYYDRGEEPDIDKIISKYMKEG